MRIRRPPLYPLSYGGVTAHKAPIEPATGIEPATSWMEARRPTFRASTALVLRVGDGYRTRDCRLADCCVTTTPHQHCKVTYLRTRACAPWSPPGSNRAPHDFQSRALPTELGDRRNGPRLEAQVNSVGPAGRRFPARRNLGGYARWIVD